VDLEKAIVHAPNGVEGTTTAKVTHINGIPVGQEGFLGRRSHTPTSPVTVVTFEITQTVGVSGNIAEMEQKIKEDVVASLGMERAKEVLRTEELQRYGDFLLGKVETDLGDGSGLVTETSSPTVSSSPTASPNSPKTGKGKGKTKTVKTSKTIETNARKVLNPFG